MFEMHDLRIGIVGLGYVGLPLAAEFGRLYPTIGFDLNSERVRQLRAGNDLTREVEPEVLAAAVHTRYTDSEEELRGCNFFIVAVPTPVNRVKRPDLGPLERASAAVGRRLAPGSVVVFESTVYPGATEEVCIPIIEQVSGLVFNRDFFAGYSPERVNPGDKQRRVTQIVKITSGSTPAAADFVDAVYRTIIPAGTCKASSLRVAEAAKVIENTQRDVNIALMNELAQIFHRVGIDTEEVLAAAGTKWNFLHFRPGLVGGHCIGVDPYYLTHKAQEVGYQPAIIPASRLINDRMGEYVAERVIRLMARRGISPVGGRVLLLGLAFKEDCPDLRNTRCVDIVSALRELNAEVEVYDPCVDPEEAHREYGITPIAEPRKGSYDAIVIAVAHQVFRDLGARVLRSFGKPGAVLFDVKYLFPAEETDERL